MAGEKKKKSGGKNKKKGGGLGAVLLVAVLLVGGGVAGTWAFAPGLLAEGLALAGLESLKGPIGLP